ncbi:protein of unknown function [Azospirillum lipoferum 4B]|uniref:Uncharacterized protein n=1 Tax=Azospirillum lipoferum (strain 4B) TaxID=862719 RepID=G7Z5A6_AZOL4|nr:protein of unknown function [Azospirillum lipoferum 4B]
MRDIPPLSPEDRRWGRAGRKQKKPRPIGSRRGRGSDLFSGLFYVARKPVDQITTWARLYDCL